MAGDAGERREAAAARVIEGLYAHAAGEAELAHELLVAAEAGAPAAPGGALEDWRLLLLGEGALERDEPEAARAFFARLLADHPASPLRAPAYVAAAELARSLRRDDEVLELVELARGEELPAGATATLEKLAWKIGRERDDPAVQLAAARRLFVDAPFTASSLGVSSSLAFGGADTDRLLSPSEVKQRAYSFLDGARLPAAAVVTLDNLPEADRDLEWHLLKAQALTGTSRPSEALDLLTGLATNRPALAARLDWERAVAAADLAERSGGTRHAERRRLLDASRRHLEKVLDAPALPAEAAPSAEALSRLYDRFMAAGRLDGATAALRLLRRVDPADTTGARDLWERGWSDYRRGDHAGAVGAWRELAAIYPETNDAQRGRYWMARALEESGQRGRARDLYEEMVATADTSDFYGRQALARLGIGGRPAELRRASLADAPSPWPTDPRLQRTKLLIDLGLDELAGREMELLDGDAPARDLLALEGLVLARRGEPRRAIPLLREAFPALGGPQQCTVPREVLYAYYPLDFVDAIRREAAEQGLPEHLVAGIIRQESAFDPRATSPVGARGLMQLMPPTARDVTRWLDMRYDPALLYEPEVSVRLGSTYFRWVLDGFGGNVELALAGYNGGPNRIRRMWEEAPPGTELDEFVENLELDESRDYLKRILILADSYRQLYPELS